MTDTPAEHIEALAGRFADFRDVEQGTMFRSPGLRTDGKIFAFAGAAGRLIVKLPVQRGHELITDGRADPVTMGKRTMREWFELPSSNGTGDWAEIALEARTYVRSLKT